MRYVAFIALAALAATAAAQAPEVTESVPTPSLASVSWQLEFDYEAPRPILLRLAGDEKPRLYWYMRYTVANLTGKDRQFIPQFTMYTDTGQILPAGRGVPSAVFGHIKKRLNAPLLIDRASVTGRLLQGRDNAKTSVAIWRDPDPKARAFDIFVSGLSGEQARVKLPRPITVETAEGEHAEKSVVLVSKTLEINYLLPGEASARVGKTPKQASRQWVMR
jgi:hypothetical protein